MARRYSPLWDLQIGVFTKKAVAAGLNGTYKDGNTIRWLSVKKLVTSPGGVLPLGPANIVDQLPGPRVRRRAAGGSANAAAAAPAITLRA